MGWGVCASRRGWLCLGLGLLLGDWCWQEATSVKGPGPTCSRQVHEFRLGKVDLISHLSLKTSCNQKISTTLQSYRLTIIPACRSNGVFGLWFWHGMRLTKHIACKHFSRFAALMNICLVHCFSFLDGCQDPRANDMLVEFKKRLWLHSWDRALEG